MTVTFPAAVANTTMVYHVVTKDGVGPITNAIGQAGSGSGRTYIVDGTVLSGVLLKTDRLLVVNSNTNPATFMLDLQTLD